MKIEGFGPLQQPEPRNKKADEAKRAANPADMPKGEPDKIDLSGTGKDRSGIYTSDLKQGASSINDIQKDLEKVKKQSQNGYYDTPQARSETSEKLIDNDDFKEVVRQYHLAKLADESGEMTIQDRPDKIAEIKKKVAEGFFNNPANYGAFADRVIKRFGL